MSPASELKGLVFNIQKFSVHDGPGIRTTVFLKGCPLRCFWCSNPESQEAFPEVSRNARKCMGPAQCGACLQACPNGALGLVAGAIQRDRELCTQCGACAEACLSGAASLVGQWMSVDEVVRAIRADSVFYDHSGGGFTLSGGEPLLQADFSAAVCQEAVKEGLAPSLETCACVPYESMGKVCDFMAHLHVDLKHLDPVRHREATGVDNKRILANIVQVGRDFPSLPKTIRMPVIPGFNDDPGHVAEVARFAAGISQARLELLPYHRLGEGKYENLGRSYGFAEVSSPGSEQMNRLREVASRYADTI